MAIIRTITPATTGFGGFLLALAAFHSFQLGGLPLADFNPFEF